MNLTVYTFPDHLDSLGYCVFPSPLEDNDLVLFHATPVENRDAIFAQGFKIPDPDGLAGLSSVSFAKKSVAALTHAMTMRKSKPGAYCIIAVRYNSLDRKGLIVNDSDIHDYTLDPPPEIVGYCDVPEAYRHV